MCCKKLGDGMKLHFSIDGRKFLTDENLAAQNFSFAPKFCQNGGRVNQYYKFCILGKKFWS